MKKPEEIRHSSTPEGDRVAPGYGAVGQSKLGPITSEVRYVAGKIVMDRMVRNKTMVVNNERTEVQRKKIQKKIYAWYDTLEKRNLRAYGIDTKGPEEYAAQLGLSPMRVLYLTDEQVGELELLIEGFTNKPVQYPWGSYAPYDLNIPIVRVQNKDPNQIKLPKGLVLESIGLHEMLHTINGFQTFHRHELLTEEIARRSGFVTKRIGPNTRKKTDKKGEQYDISQPDTLGLFFEEAFARYHEIAYVHEKMSQKENIGQQLKKGKIPLVVQHNDDHTRLSDEYNIAGLALHLLATKNPELPALMLNVRKGEKGSLLAFRKGITAVAPGLYGKLQKLQYEGTYDFEKAYRLIYKAVLKK